MKMWHFAVTALSALVLYTIIFLTAKKKKPFKRAFYTMLIGVLSLVIIDVSGMFTGVYLPISPLTLTLSACGGVPAVAVMIIINCFL